MRESAPAQKALGKGPFGAGGFGQSVERGAIPIIFAATSDEMSGTVQVCRAAAAGLASERGEITRTPAVSVLTCGVYVWQRINCSVQSIGACFGHQIVVHQCC